MNISMSVFISVFMSSDSGVSGYVVQLFQQSSVLKTLSFYLFFNLSTDCCNSVNVAYCTDRSNFLYIFSVGAIWLKIVVKHIDYGYHINNNSLSILIFAVQ